MLLNPPVHDHPACTQEQDHFHPSPSKRDHVFTFSALSLCLRLKGSVPWQSSEGKKPFLVFSFHRTQSIDQIKETVNRHWHDDCYSSSVPCEARALQEIACTEVIKTIWMYMPK